MNKWKTDYVTEMLIDYEFNMIFAFMCLGVKLICGYYFVWKEFHGNGSQNVYTNRLFDSLSD